MEDVRKLSKIAALDQKIPGPVCGNPDCEDLCAEAFDAALSLRLAPMEVLQKTIERELHCLPADAEDSRACRFGFIPVSDSLALSAKKKKEDNEVIHIFRTGANECEDCRNLNGTEISQEEWANKEKMKEKGFPFTENGQYVPHPNCKCHWEEKRTTQIIRKQAHKEAKKKKNNEIVTFGKADINKSKTVNEGPYFKRGKGHSVEGIREDTATVLDHLTARIIFDGIDDLIKQLEQRKYLPHSIDKLVIIGHGGGDNDYKMGSGDLDQLNSITDEQVRQLKNFLHTDSVVDIRMCRAASGVEGKKTAQMLANKLNCTVIAHEGYVSEKGGPADYIFPWNAPELSPRDWIHPPYKRREFRPRDIEKRE